LFNYYIQQSPYGKILLHGTWSGTKARDTLSGGVFTNAFLHVASNMITKMNYQGCSIYDVVHHVEKVLEKTGSTQKPQFYLEGNLQITFAIALPYFNRTQVPIPQSITHNNNQGLELSQIAAMFLLIIIVGGMMISFKSL
jgi:hypothetical protein